MAGLLLYYLNYGILAAFLSLFCLEIGMAIYTLYGYRRYYGRARRYVMPLWEITGTFAVFYATSLVAIYPNLIPVIAPVYIGPVVAVALLLILRNAFLGYTEVMGGHRWERYAFAIYSVSTLAVAFLLSAILGSSVSGIGIDAAAGSINLIQMLFNGFDVPVFAALAAMGYLAATVLVGERAEGARGIGIARRIAVPLIFIAIMAFATMQNQELFGKTSSLSSYLTNGAAGQDLAIATLGGGAFLAVALAYFVYITYMKRPAR